MKGKTIKALWYASLVLGTTFPGVAFAGDGFDAIVDSIADSLSNTPVLFAVICYLAGISFVLMGIFRLKQHVESPSNMPMKNVLSVTFIGGALLAAPYVVESAQGSIDGHVTGSTEGIHQQIKQGIKSNR